MARLNDNAQGSLFNEVVTTERGGRPQDVSMPSAPLPSASMCPFCPGQERLTPKEILAYRPHASEPDSPNWTVRVIPNKFPALHVEGDMGREGLGLYDRMNGIGAHEVIIETPNHKEHLADLPAKRVEDVLWAYRDRILDLKKDLRLRYILIFKNQGIATLSSSPCRSCPPASSKKSTDAGSISSRRNAASIATSCGRNRRRAPAWCWRTRNLSA